MPKTNNVVLVLVGLPGSGKTTFAQKFAQKHSFIHINSDHTRRSYFPNPSLKPEERKKVYQKMFDLTIECLKRGENVIFDGNLITNTERKKALSIFDGKAKVFFIIFEVPVNVALNKALGRQKDDTGFYKPMRKNLAQKMHSQFEKIDESLPHVTIDGYASFDEQDKMVLKT